MNTPVTPVRQAAPPVAINKTAQQVIDIYTALGLPVIEDRARIEEAIAKYKPRYLKEGNSPDPVLRAKAKEWFANVDLLIRKLPEMLEIIYREAVLKLDGMISAFLASGTTTVTAEMLAEMRKNIETFKTDAVLTTRFLDRYIKDKGLKKGGGLVDVDPVESFTAVSGLGRIELAWHRPAANCETVEIDRQDTRSGKNQTIYQGAGTSCTDTAAEVGHWYTYRAYSVNKKVRSDRPLTATPDRVVCLGEVTRQKAEWREGKIRLTWERPVPEMAVLIFRRNGKAPAVRSGGGKPVPESLSTRLLYEGSGSSWEDDVDIVEGANYHYLIIARFGTELCSQGVAVQLTVPRSPQAPAELTAVCRHQGTTYPVTLAWEAVAEQIAVEYVLVRCEGATPAARPEERHTLVVTRQFSYVDETAQAGRRYTYTLFTKAGEMFSKTGASRTVDILPEVSHLAAKTGDGTVDLSWQPPPEALGVIVRRRIEPPRDARDGLEIRKTGQASARDEEAVNGRTYHYLVACIYQPDGIDTVYSPGVRISAMPVRLPDPVRELNATPLDLQITLSWPVADYGGTVAIYRLERPHNLPVGTRFDLARLDSLLKETGGEPVIAGGADRAVDSQPRLDRPNYASFTVVGDHVVVGAVRYATAIPDIDKLRLTATNDGIILRWSWPKDCKAVTVMRRDGAWPTGVADQEAVLATVSLDDYQSAGEKYKQILRGEGGNFHYIVYAQAYAGGVVHAAGEAAGCRGSAAWRPWIVLRYYLPQTDAGRRDDQMRLVFRYEKMQPDFAGFLLLADQNGVPGDAASGIELFRWQPEGPGKSGEGEAWISLAPIKNAGWPFFHCKLIACDPSQAANLLIVHPDVCERINTRWQGSTKVPGRVVDFSKTPKTTICPFCLDEFPIDELLFRPEGGGEAIAGGRGWWQRLRNRPIEPPAILGKGRIDKVCPRCKEKQHISAGVQEDIVIGMVGAKFSGKSHYVASLIHRLEGRGAADMYAALMQLGDHTTERYRNEFYRPLFEDRLTLEATSGAPPPLVFDMTIDRQLWMDERSRSVTLALYDTAGENFDNQTLVAQMVRYLQVASGIIFLVDPTQSRGIQQYLPEEVRSAAPTDNADPQAIISRVIQELVNNKVLGADAALDKPVAMVLTKCDVLQQCGLIPENRLWTMEERHVGRFRKEIHEDMSGMIGELLWRTNLPAYNLVKLKFPRHAFFGVSSTGCAPNKRGRFPFIAPWRVVDPLFWLLAELGVIPIEEHWALEVKKEENGK